MKKLLIELKAKYGDLEKAREILRKLKAEYIGTFHQIDTYFIVDNKRLKLRAINNKKFILVYYERPNIPSIKESKVILHEVYDKDSLIEILSRLFGIKVVVDKIREIYRYKGVQVHLDIVDKLGTYIEFEKETNTYEYERDKKLLETLLRLFGINKNDVVSGSYSDILLGTC